MLRNHCKQASHFLFSVLYSPRWNGSEHFKGKLLASVICTMLVVQTSIDIDHFFQSIFILYIVNACKDHVYIYNSYFLVHVYIYWQSVITPLTFSSLFIKKKMAKGVCNIIVISHIHIYLHCIYVFVYWYHLYDCVYHEINNYFIKLKQFFLFDKEYSTCTMVWKNRTRHNTTCLLFGWRYFFLLGEKYLTSGVYVSRISR